LPATAPALLAALLVAVPSPAGAVDADVTVANNQFTPATVRVQLGEQVTWTFEDAASHSTTSDEGFWDSGAQSSGDTYVQTFASAGTYGYHCSFHLVMNGRVAVPLQASGSAEDGWAVRWSTEAAGEGRDFDVQVRRKGAEKWTWWKRDTTKASGAFDRRAGTWLLRARTSTTDAGTSSGWSPVRRVRTA
jgi:plastocyanin